MSKSSNLLPQRTTLQTIGEPFIELPTVESTNNYAMALAHKGLVTNGTAFFAHHQTAGKGQRGKRWTSNPGENITLSIVLEPWGYNLSTSFLLSATIALGCYHFFKNYAGDDCRIKWPNDIYWNDRKAGGILIENLIREGLWKVAVIGIGMNINQTSFDLDTRPVSLKQITGKNYPTIDLAMDLCKYLNFHYHRLQQSGVMKEYNDALYKRGEIVRLKKDNAVFETTIKKVSPQGTLLCSDVIDREFAVGDVEYLM